MNSKTCKNLRRMAEATTVGLPYRAYSVRWGRFNKVTLELTDCTRAVYRGYKRNYKALGVPA